MKRTVSKATSRASHERSWNCYAKMFQMFQYREERFRQTSESTHRRVFWWSLTQTVVVLIMGAWQMKHLKSFFEAKKLV